MTSPARKAASAGMVLAAALTVVTGGPTGTGSAAPDSSDRALPETSAASVSLRQDCAFTAPLGKRTLASVVAADLPTTAAVRSPLRLGRLTVRLTVPNEVARALIEGAEPGSPGPSDPGSAPPAATDPTTTPPASGTPAPAGTASAETGTTSTPAPPSDSAPGSPATLTGGLRTELTVEQDGKRETVRVPLTAEPASLPASGDVQLVAGGDVPEIVLTGEGVARIGVGETVLALGSAPKGAAVAQVPCTPAATQDSGLGSVLITPADGSDGKARSLADGASPEEEFPPDEYYITPLGFVRLDSTTSVRRVGATLKLKPTALLDAIGIINIVIPGAPLLVRAETRLPPSQVSFLAYGFVPVTATVELLPLDYRESTTLPVNASVQDGIGTAHLDLTARLSGVQVNGVPLDVGDNCVTAKPVEVDLTGPYDPFGFGELRTDPSSPDPKFRGFTLPPFAGCGATEPLSPVFSGLASGTGNQAAVRLNTLLPCGDPDSANCGNVAAARAAAKKQGNQPR